MDDLQKQLLRLQAGQDQIDAAALDVMKSIHSNGVGDHLNVLVTHIATELQKNGATKAVGFLLLFGKNKADEIYINSLDLNRLDNGEY